MTEQQWNAIKTIIEREQQRALQHSNNAYYRELSDILNVLPCNTNTTQHISELEAFDEFMDV